MEVVGNAVIAIGMVMLFGLPFAILRPSLVRLRRRRHAFAFWSFSLIVIVIGADLKPESTTGGAGSVAALFFWAGLMAISFAALWLINRARHHSKVSGTVEAWGERNRARRSVADERAALARERAVLDEERAALARMSARGMTEGAAVPSSRFVAPPTPPRAPRARLRAPVEQHWEVDDYGEEASFTYVDADGVVTDRTIVNWRSEGPYIRGICVQRRQSRTFRKDRIEDWSSI